jgi:hypothetical protein
MHREPPRVRHDRFPTRVVVLAVVGLPLAVSSVSAREPAEVVFAPGPDVSIPGAPGRALPEPARPRIREHLRIVWYDPNRLLPGTGGEVWQEVGSIFNAIGVNVGWQVGGFYGDAGLPEVPVILLQQDPRRSRARANIMGLVMRNQEPTRAVWVFLGPVRRNLGLPDDARPSDLQEERLVARAVARIVVHEAVHAIAPDEPHSRNGLMRHALDRAFLLGRRPALDARCASGFLLQLDLAAEATKTSANGGTSLPAPALAAVQ